jgi:hypothetical protein
LFAGGAGSRPRRRHTRRRTESFDPALSRPRHAAVSSIRAAVAGEPWRILSAGQLGRGYGTLDSAAHYGVPRPVRIGWERLEDSAEFGCPIVEITGLYGAAATGHDVLNDPRPTAGLLFNVPRNQVGTMVEGIIPVASRQQTTGAIIETREREAKALELRKHGASLSEIARAVGYTNESGASKAIRRSLARLDESDAAELREIEASRLEAGRDNRGLAYGGDHGGSCGRGWRPSLTE